MSLISTETSHPTTLLPPPENQTPLLTLVWLKGGAPGSRCFQIVENMFRHSSGPYGSDSNHGR